MSGTSTGYLHTGTGSKPPNPCPEASPDNTFLKERIDELIQFIDGHHFCLMTTRQKNTEYLVSRCMAVTAREGIDLLFYTDTASGKTDELVGDPHVNIGFLKESNVSSLSCVLCYLKLI